VDERHDARDCTDDAGRRVREERRHDAPLPRDVPHDQHDDDRGLGWRVHLTSWRQAVPLELLQPGGETDVGLRHDGAWSYTTTTIRQANGAAGNKVEFVQGVSEDVVSGTLSATVEMETTTSPPSIGIGLDTTTAYSSNLRVTTYNSTSTYITMPVSIPFSLIIAEGYHYLAWLEKGASATTCKFGGKEDSADQNAFSVVFLG
jgi:hypothetical protein